MLKLVPKLARQLIRMIALTALAGLACALLVRFAPGANIDDRELDLRLSEQTRSALRAENEARNHLSSALLGYFRGLAHGDLGYSHSRNAPIADLISDAAPETLRELSAGLALSWLAALAMAIPSGRSFPARGWTAASSAFTGLLLSLPAALLAYLCLSAGAKTELVFALALMPKIYPVSKNLLAEARAASFVDAARAWGLSESRILWLHVLPAAAPQMIALAATTVALAAGAAIPIETICDVPGLGRLAWQAATARDLPLLINLTMLVALATTAAVAVAELATAWSETEAVMA